MAQGYFLNAAEVEKLEEMIRNGESDEYVADVLSVSRPAVAYRRKKMKESGFKQFRTPEEVRAEARSKISEAMRANQNARRGGPVVLMHKRRCISCGSQFETDQPRNQHKCDPCRTGLVTGDDGEPFRNFVLYR